MTGTFEVKVLKDGNIFNSLPNDIFFLVRTKLKAFADDKKQCDSKIKFFFFGKGRKHFLLFPECFQMPPFSRSLKVGIVW